MQLGITIAIVTICALMLGRGLVRAIFPSLNTGKRANACGCSGGCPALRKTEEQKTAPATSAPADSHRPAA
jgi:hypothetical protein